MLHTTLEMLDNPGSYFELSDSIAQDESHEETRYADRLEVHTVCHVSLFDWETAWKPEGFNQYGYPLRHSADSIFFDPLVYAPATPKDGTATALQ